MQMPHLHLNANYHNSDSHNNADSHNVSDSYNTNEWADKRQYSNMNNRTVNVRDVTIARDRANVLQNFGTLSIGQNDNTSG